VPAVENLAFDAITKSLSRWRTRRGLVTGAGIGAVAAILGAALEPDETEARRRRVRGEHNIRGKKAIMCLDGQTVKVPKKKRKKYLKQGATRGKCTTCTPVCTPGICGDDGCGGTCGCAEGTICVSGICEPCDVGCASGDSVACGQSLNEALAEGGTVRVCPGTYQGRYVLNEHVEIIGAGSGSNPASNTILLGMEKQGAVVSVTKAINVKLSSLRVTGGNGSSQDSGGVYLNNMNADVTIENCALVHNTGSYGGGVSNYNGTLTVRGCDISYNTAYSGGGVAAAKLSTFESTTITYNTAESLGGGYFFNSGVSNLASSVTISNNTAKSDPGTGGGIYRHPPASDATAILNNSATVTNNSPDNCAGNGLTC
jgi:hypothetical protein